MNVNISNTKLSDIANGNKGIGKQKQDEQKNTYIGKLQKQMMGLEKQIADIRENDQLSVEDKKERLQQLEEQKEQLMLKINEAQVREKMEESEKKIEEVEEKAKKMEEASKKPATPLEEMKVELGIEDVPAKLMIKAGKALSTAKNKLVTSSKMRGEARILKKEYETDKGRGQAVTADDYRLVKSMKLASKAESIENDAYAVLGKVNNLVEGAMKQIEKNKENASEIKKNLQGEEKNELPLEEQIQREKELENGPVGHYVDIRL